MNMIKNKKISSYLIVFLFIVSTLVPINLSNELNDTGLVGYWNFDDCTASDSSGDGNHGQNQGAECVDGVIGNGFDFFEVTDIVTSIPSSFDDGISDEFTISCWLRWHGPQNDLQTNIFDNREDSWMGGGFIFYINKFGHATLRIRETGDDQIVISESIIPLEEWTHIAAVFNYNAHELKIFINGVEDNSSYASSSYSESSYNSVIGNNHWAPGDNQWRSAHGILDEIRIHNRALTETEINDLYQLSSGLVGYWNFDEGMGNVVHDNSINNNDGTVYGGTWIPEGILNGALSFDGIDDYVSILDDPSLNFHDNNSFSISLWVKRNDNPNTSKSLISKGHQTPSNGYQLLISANDQLVIRIGDGVENYRCISNQMINDFNWNHFVAVWDGEYLLLYINGFLDNSTHVGPNFITNDHKNLEISNHYSNFFNGIIDEIRIYGCALTENEINYLYQQGQQTGLLGYWNFDDCTASDSSGDGNHGQNQGAECVDGVIGNGFDFFEVTDIVTSIPSSFDDGISDEFTISCWLRWHGPQNDLQTNIFDNREDSWMGGGFIFYINKFGHATLRIRETGDDQIVISESIIPLEEWTHIAAVFNYNAHELKIFINGVEDNSSYASSSYSESSYNSVIGNNHWAPGDNQWRSAHGILDEIRIHNYALSKDEIIDLYNQVDPRITYVDDDYTQTIPGWGFDHFDKIQDGINAVENNGNVIVYNGNYDEQIQIYKTISLMGNGTPIIKGNNQKGSSIIINADNVSVDGFEFAYGDPIIHILDGKHVVINHNFIIGEDCTYKTGFLVDDTITSVVDARYNFWGAPDGPSGELSDASTGRIADGLGNTIQAPINMVLFDPWWGIDALADVSKLNVFVGDSITFDASDSIGFGYDEDDLTLSYLWDFDTMDFSMDEVISYSYDEPGVYNGYLRVSAIDPDLSDSIMYDWDYFTIIVSEPGQPLGANADGNDLGGYEGIIDEPVTLYGLATGGVPGYSFEWDINGHTLTGQTVEYTFTEAGTYTVELTVTDNEFNTANDTASVYIAELDELVAKAGGPYKTTENELVQFIGSATGGKSPYSFTWEFGDGSSPITVQNPLHVYEAEGTYTVTLTVTDSKGTVDDATTTITVSSQHDEPEILDVTGGLSIKATIVAADLPVDWMISLDGSYVFGRTIAAGTVAANAQETIRAPYVLGLGNVDITIQANDVVLQHTAFMLGPIVILL